MRDEFGIDIASVGEPGSGLGMVYVCVHFYALHYSYNAYLCPKYYIQVFYSQI